MIPLFCISLLIIMFYNFTPISNNVINVLTKGNKLIINAGNKYEKDYGFDYVQNTDSFIPYSKQDLINIIYTTINKGWKEFTFYCPNEYTKCVQDITNISENESLLTDLNNFVHPYNSFTNIKTSISDSGEIVLTIYYLYNDDQISLINQKVDYLIQELVDKNASDYDNIKAIHDYIINNTKYDVERNTNKSSNYLSFIAYGPLFEGYATCNGYTDLMAIILSKLSYPNFKVSTSMQELKDDETGHIWNAVYINNKWLHLDLTWDDPVSNDGKDYLYHTYFLITTEELNKADSGKVSLNDHKFNTSIYTELK